MRFVAGSIPIGAGRARRTRSALVLAILVACSSAVLEPADARDRGHCRRAEAGAAGQSVGWLRADGFRESASLEAWCAAVGRPFLMAPEAASPSGAALGALTVVVWNVHAGQGDLERLVAELRAGDLGDGRRVDHFVLLLQEARRTGGSVPEPMPPGARAARAIAAPADPSRSIDAVAARAGLFAFYAPSMRNGKGFREDRGNAILSTLPLRDAVGIELPYERQRRVAVAASIAVPTRGGASRTLRLASAHFDNFSSGTRVFRSFGAGRGRQARALLVALRDHETAALGGDLNTWFGESGEDAVVLLRRYFPLPRLLPAAATHTPPYGLPRRQVDYLLLRLPDGWKAGYRVDSDARGSDHAPLIGWIEPPPEPASAALPP
jgi:endonuclease/exonuclease/phosphatase family metal-dependent hydrolase